MVYLKAWLQKKIPFFRFSSSKEEKKPFRTWIRVPGSYGQQFVIPQNDDDEVAGTADMGFEEDAGEEEVIGVEDSAADQEVEVEEPTAELDGQMQEGLGWEEEAEEEKGHVPELEEEMEEVKDEEMYDVEDWAVDGAAAYDEGEGDEKMNEGYDEDEEEERINAAGLAAFDEIVAGDMASFAAAKEEVDDDLAKAEAAQAKKAEDARVKERVERAKVIATCPPWRNKGGGGERYEKKWKGGGGGWKGRGGGNKKGKGKGGGRKGGFVKKIEKNEKGKGKKKDEKEEDGRPRLPTPPRVPPMPRLPTPPRVPSSGSDGWRGDGGGRWWGKDEEGGGRKREKYEGGGGRWKKEDGGGGERWEEYGGGGDETWKGGGKQQGGGKRGKGHGSGGCAGPDDDYIPCSSGGWYIKGGHGWVSPDGVYHPYLGNHSGKFSLFPPLSIYTLPFELCDRMFCMFTPGSGMLHWYIVLYVRVVMSNDLHTSGDVSWIVSSLVHHVPFDHLLVFPNLLSSLVHVHAFPY